MSRILELRAEELQQNQKPIVAVPGGVTCPIAVALLEYEAGLLRPRLVRHGPGGDERREDGGEEVRRGSPVG